MDDNQYPFRSFTELTALAGPAPRIDLSVEHSYVMIHTAAVDGRPRGALLSQFGLIAASAQLLHYWQLDERDVGVLAVPLFHVAGLGLLVTLQLAGAAAAPFVRLWGALLMIAATLYFPGWLDPLTMRWPNVVGVAARVLLALIYLLLGGGFLWLALIEVVFAVALGLAYLRYARAELMSRP